MPKLVRNVAAVVRKSRKKPHIAAQILGWYGAFAIIAGFMCISFSLLKANSIAYQLLNFTGALGLLTLGIDKHIRQSVVVNIFWAAIAGIALVNIFF